MQKKLNVQTQVCRTEPDYVYNIKTNEYLEEGSKITALCAIGQPEQFFNFLKDYDIKEKIAFDDHHIYKEEDIPEGTIITTEKDAVKMLNFNRCDIYALKLKIVIDIEQLMNTSTL